ncbi:unnamed protein product [Schistosoma margrebowiei]|uniref:Uncharacterized protein n=1 Tax=Schistosoma margrebowiei TaxID=48269 RepID=A0A183MUI3_9TREM|nr:unnamed protein product [Schistosoma margrebowiei]
MCQKSEDSKLCSISLLSSGRNSVPNFIHGNVLNQEKGYGYLTFNETSYRHAKSFGSLEARTGFYHLKIKAEDCSHPTKSTKSWPITFEVSSSLSVILYMRMNVFSNSMLVDFFY